MIVENLKRLNYIEGVDKKFTSSINSDYLDNDIYESSIQDIEELNDMIDKNSESVKTPFFNKLGQDIFNALYKKEPGIYSKDNIRQSLDIEYDIVNKIINASYFDDLRKTTAGDLFNTTYALQGLLNSAVKNIDEWVNESEANAAFMDNINEIIDKQNILDNLKNTLENDPDNEYVKMKLEQTQQDVDNLNSTLDNSNPNTQPNTQNIGNDVQNTSVDLKSMNDSVGCFFTNDETGELVALSYKERVTLSNMIKDNSKLQEIAKYLGRMKEAMKHINKKPNKMGYEITDVTTGNKLNKMLSSQKTYLAIPSLENQFYKKYVGKNLLIYETKGMEQMQGPIIICLDDSGSMEGERDYWAKAIALAMLQLAIKQKRAFRCIIFGSRVDKIYDFDKDTFVPSRVFEMASFFKGGGTNFTPPLRSSLDAIEESKYNKADILFITDGESDVENDFLKRFKKVKEEKEFVVQGILVGSGRTAQMERFCDSVTTFKDLNKDGELVNIFANIKLGSGDDSSEDN